MFEAETSVCLSLDKSNSELVSHVIISPVVGEFERCNATGVVRSDSLGKFEGLLIGVESILACFVFSLSF